MKRRYHLQKMRQQGALCHYCKHWIERGRATIDHIVPRALGGTVSQVNTVPACLDCNMAKGDSFPTCHCPHCQEAVIYFLLHRLVRNGKPPRLHEVRLGMDVSPGREVWERLPGELRERFRSGDGLELAVPAHRFDRA